MAITAATVADSRARARLFVLFSLGGIAAGMAAGWHSEFGDMSLDAQALGPAFAGGWAMELLQLTSIPLLRDGGWATTYFLVVKDYPNAAAALAVAIKKAVLFPWPLVGWTAGMGGMVLLSKFNEFSNKRS